MPADQSGRVRIWVLDSDPSIQQLSFHFPWAKENIKKADAYHAVQNADPDLDAGSVVRCCTGFAPFYCTRAKADVRIRTFGPRSASHLLNRVPYCLKTRHTKGGANLFIFYQKTIVKISKAAWLRREPGSGSSDPDLSKIHQNRKMRIIPDPNFIWIHELY
jgi:hypothetical protein